MPPDAQQSPPRKPTIFRRILERYGWISRRNKIAIWSFLILAVALGVSLRWIHPAYLTAKMWLFVNMAEKATAKKDYESASLAYRKALMCNAQNPAAWQSLAKFLDEVHSPEVIRVWERLATLQPEEKKYRFNEARAALNFNRLYEADEILNEMPPRWRSGAEYLRLRAETDGRKKTFPEAEKSLQALVALDPTDEQAAFDLLSVQSQLDDLSVQTAAREKLTKISEGPSRFAAPALRLMIAREGEAENFFEADRLASKLILRPDATLEDRLLHAQLELRTSSFSLPVTLANLRTYATHHPEALSAVLSWLMSSKTEVEATSQWVNGLPESVTSREDTQPAVFQFYLAVGNWDRVFKILKESRSVIHLPPKVLDLASKALEQNGEESNDADQTWRQAIYAAEGNPSVLRVLSLLASAREWTSATGLALSALAESAPGDGSAWALLIQHENAVRNMPGLYAALQGLIRLNPYDISIASNWVLAAAMVRPGNLDEVLDVAKRTYYSTYPSDPRAATAYAMAFLRMGRVKDALNFIDQMSEADRREPQRAIYVGSVLAANGRNAEALDYFARSESLSVDPFPEEITLRRIWKGVALGEATTAEEAAKMMLKRKDADADAGRINTELRSELRRRANPEEAQRIFESLKENVGKRQAPPPEVQNLIREMQAKENK